MHARKLLASATVVLSLVGALEAAPWERADSKILGNNVNQNSNQVRRSTRAYSYSPAPNTATQTQATQLQPTRMPAVQTPTPAARPAQNLAPRAQSAPANVAVPATGNSQQPTYYAQPQTRSYRSYSYQPNQTFNRGTTRRSTRVPFYMRADSKVLGREGAF